MRILTVAALIMTAGFATACFTSTPEQVEYYAMSIDNQGSDLVINTRPNMDAQVKRIMGITDDGTNYVVDVCLGVSTGQAVSPIADQDVMVCVGRAEDPLGFNIQQVGCFDGRSNLDVAPAVTADLVAMGSGMQALEGNLTVDIQTETGPQNVDTDFRVRVSTAEAAEQAEVREQAVPEFQTPWFD